MTTRSVISKHSDWLNCRNEFPNLSDYRAFSKKYQFNPNSKIFRTSRTVDEVLTPRAVKRRLIFEEYLLDGLSVEDVNLRAAKIPGGEHDADIFIGLHTGYIQLEDIRPVNNLIPVVTARSTIFMNNRSQAVRLPKQVAFPEDVHQVEIIKIGHSRVISPVGRRWNDLFQNGPHASDDFMSKPIDLPAEVRESL